MTVAIGIWSLELTPGKLETVEPQADIRITNVSFGEVTNESGRSLVKFTYQAPSGIDSDSDEDGDDGLSLVSQTTVLCSLKPGTFEQALTNIVLQADEQYEFQVTGQNAVYLTGNYLDQGVNNPPFMDSEDEMSSDDEDAYDLRDVSSDVEMHPDDLVSNSSRFEEVQEEAPTKPQKRPREPEPEAETEKPSKAEKKKKKKQKGDDGKAIDVAGEEKKPEEKKIEKKERQDKQAKQESNTAKAKKAKATEREIAGGVKILDAKVGTGPAAKKGDTVRMRYIGKLQNGHVFDKNVSGKPFTFNLGKGEVIKGWDEGIVGMHVGGERKLTIPPTMAYGSKAMGDIPKNSTLLFEVKLLEIK